MSRNPNIDRAARVIATAIVHGTNADIALEIAQALDDTALLVRPGCRETVPTPAEVAEISAARRAQTVVDNARGFEDMPGAPRVTAAGPEVRVVVHPTSLADWGAWTARLNVRPQDVTLVGHSAVATGRCGGVRVRVTGLGVPALVGASLRRTSSKGVSRV